MAAEADMHLLALIGGVECAGGAAGENGDPGEGGAGGEGGDGGRPFHYTVRLSPRKYLMDV